MSWFFFTPLVIYLLSTSFFIGRNERKEKDLWFFSLFSVDCSLLPIFLLFSIFRSSSSSVFLSIPSRLPSLYDYVCLMCYRYVCYWYVCCGSDPVRWTEKRIGLMFIFLVTIFKGKETRFNSPPIWNKRKRGFGNSYRAHVDLVNTLPSFLFRLSSLPLSLSF